MTTSRGIWVTDKADAHALYRTGWKTVHRHTDVQGRSVRFMQLQERRHNEGRDTRPSEWYPAWFGKRATWHRPHDRRRK